MEHQELCTDPTDFVVYMAVSQIICLQMEIGWVSGMVSAASGVPCDRA